MSFTPSHYLQRAAELEASAAETSDSTERIDCLELAQRFRDMANLGSVSQMESDEEAIRLVERILGKPPRPDKH